jgi:hypothetical protein
MRTEFIHRGAFVSVLLAGNFFGQEPVSDSRPEDDPALWGFECGFEAEESWLPRWVAAVESGEVRVPPPPPVAPAPPEPAGVHGVFGPAHIFVDAQQRLLTNFTDLQAVELMRDAANAVIATYGDRFDFVGFFTNFQPHHTIGSAFYRGVENDVQGIRQAGGYPPPIFNLRPTLGIAGNRVEGMLMMWNVNGANWRPGSGQGTMGTRLSLNHEFGHRFACFLPPISGGRSLQGTGGTCGTPSHWSLHVDGQGSAMQIPEWLGTPPVFNGLLRTNLDTGWFYSYLDLYLMGFVSPAEVGAGISQLRHITSVNCQQRTCSGAYTNFTVADVVAAAGTRVPGSSSSQKNFRTAWVMIHLPGDTPSSAELVKAAGIIAQQSIDWTASTLGRSSMNHTLYDSDVVPYGCGVNPPGSLSVISGSPSIGTQLVLGVDNPLGTQHAGSLAFLMLANAPAPGFPCGVVLPGLGMASPSAPGELLVDVLPPNPLRPMPTGGEWNTAGQPAPVVLNIPNEADLIGTSFYDQGGLYDALASPGARFKLAQAFQLLVGP